MTNSFLRIWSANGICSTSMLYRWKWDSLHVSGRSLNRSWLFKHTYTQTKMQRCQYKISYNTIFVDYGGVSRFLIINAKFVLINPSPPEGKSPLHLNKLGLVIHKPPTCLPMGRDFSLATSQWGEMVRLGLGHPFKTVQNLTFSTIEHQLNKNNCRGVRTCLLIGRDQPRDCHFFWECGCWWIRGCLRHVNFVNLTFLPYELR